MANPLNGSLSVAVVGGSDHAHNVREKTTVCGKNVDRRNTLRDFPMRPDKACMECVVGLTLFMTGVTTVDLMFARGEVTKG